MHTINPGSKLLDELARESEAAKARSEKSALLKVLSDFVGRNANRTATIQLSGRDAHRLLELVGDKHPAIAQRLTGCNALVNEVMVLPGEGELLYRLVLNS